MDDVDGSSPERPANADDEIVLGIDVGATGIKAALVDVHTGALSSERRRVATPQPCTIDGLCDAVRTLVEPFSGAYNLAGIGFPASVRRGIVLSAVNIDDGWVEADLGRIFGERLGVPVWGLNDADAAAVAEATFGAGRDVDGTVVIVTLGTGVGTTLVVDGHLVPNIELGLLTVRGKIAGKRVSNQARVEQKLGWSDWAADLDRFLHKLELAVVPDLIVIGGGVSEEAAHFIPKLTVGAPVVPAILRNDAGIAGAAFFAWAQVRIRRRDGAHPPQIIDLRRPPAPSRPRAAVPVLDESEPTAMET